jgi:hypothetical protein
MLVVLIFMGECYLRSFDFGALFASPTEFVNYNLSLRASLAEDHLRLGLSPTFLLFI